ncbi:MAG: winged helix-turn-helix transcriptional regulator [Deltaproteobacteria bacterium]|nr:winged helix-turn-helix transcriptional regulator [Deltaproteobacteria bacterium]
MEGCRWPVNPSRKRNPPEPVVKEVAGIFRVLSGPTRIRIIHVLLARGERPVGEIAEELGMGVAAVSNQLRKMADLGIVGKMVRGNFAFYRVTDPCVGVLLHRAYCLSEDGKTRRRGR